MMERIFERVLFASRRLLAPFYAAFGIVVRLVELLQALAHFVLHMHEPEGADRPDHRRTPRAVGVGNAP